jgi:hypothetical protein
MNRLLTILLSLLLIAESDLMAQRHGFTVKKTSFSSSLQHEFSPVFYQGGLVFCSDLRDNSLVSYENNQKNLYKIYYIRQTGKAWKKPVLLSKDLTTSYNDGPVSFNEQEDIIYFSRNNFIGNYLRNISDTSNKLGIFRAELSNGEWTNIKPLDFNNIQYNFITPSITMDGTRIYFSSDMPGGYGGMDLYFSEKKGNRWDKPVNLGPVINTSGSETFPFAARDGKLFFSSDGHPGFGGKDIYYTQEINGVWINPVHLDSAINSAADDFGLVTDSTFESGYFSTNRLKTDDIFSFVRQPVNFSHCDTIRENNYCFTFYDERQQLLDTVQATYIWDFGDGIKRTGKEVKFCFPGAGNYTVKLSITDDVTGKAIADQVNYDVELKDFEQAEIHSDNIGLAGQVMSFEGSTSKLRNFRVKEYFWNYGNGFEPGGLTAGTTFKKPGTYTIQLGLQGEMDSLGVIPQRCFIKNIDIFNAYHEMHSKGKALPAPVALMDNSGKAEGSLEFRTYFMDDLTEDQRRTIEKVMNSCGESMLNYKENGTLPAESELLKSISTLMPAHPDLRLELTVHFWEQSAGKSPALAEKLAHELAFYFKNRQVSGDAIHCTFHEGIKGIFNPDGAEQNTGKGMLELVFMKNKIKN